LTVESDISDIFALLSRLDERLDVVTDAMERMERMLDLILDQSGVLTVIDPLKQAPP
jgi:hypothetical protein